MTGARPTVPLAAPDDVHLLGEEGVGGAHDRPDVEVVLPVLDRDVELMTPMVEIGDHRLPPPIAIAVDDVAPVTLAEQGRIETRVVRPLAGPGPDADLELVVSHGANPRL